ncbi:MAG: 4Fe-4S binding protein [Clostridia bacterium]|nr:4Fe-4S binding protein [Clostridia bacterium]
MAERRNGKRHIVQALWTALTNANLPGFFKGRIFSGASKAVCVPGLNCYSCPGALGACPIGALQSELGARQVKLPFYAMGFLLFFGAVFGRFICGFLCPFGLVQDLLYKIPTRKIGAFRADRPLRYVKYLVLALLVVLLPALLLNAAGAGTPWFCKLLCPAGTLGGGVPLMLADGGLRAQAGLLFYWKLFVLIALLALSVCLYRPFCKYLCPLGAAYALFNRVSLYQLRVDGESCTRCGRCKSVCRMGVDPVRNAASAECIRCGDCVKTCPQAAIRAGFCAKKNLQKRKIST